MPAQEGCLIARGDIFLVDLGTCAGIRLLQPVLVIQNDIGNRFGDSVIVVPLFPNLPIRKLLLGVVVRAGGSTGLAVDHTAVFSQIYTLDKALFRRENFVGRLGPEAMARVDEAIKVSLGLTTLQRLASREKQAPSGGKERKRALW